MATQQYIRRSFLIAITENDLKKRATMRNALWRLGGKEILPSLYIVALTPAERQALARRFRKIRVRER